MNKTKSSSTTVYLDKILWAEFQKYCAANRRIRSASDEFMKFMKTTIATKGAKYGLKVPHHLITTSQQ